MKFLFHTGYNDSSWTVPYTVPADGGDLTIPDEVAYGAEFIWYSLQSVMPSENKTEDTMYCRHAIPTGDNNKT